MTSRHFAPTWPVLLLSVLVATSIIAMGFFFYRRSHHVLQDQIRKNLATIAAVSALSFDGDAIDEIQNAGDIKKKIYIDTVQTLQRLRTKTGMRYAYILRKTDTPLTLAFVADADDALTDHQLDTNGNGRVDDDEEAALPGEMYDISTIEMLQKEAFEHPTADRELTIDQWGVLVSGYAPIVRADGTVSAVLGFDMRADDFIRLSGSIFGGQAMGIVFLAALAAAGGIIALWEHRRISVLHRINAERSGLLRLTFHQLGEPLTIMKWSLETLREQVEDENLKKLVDEHVECMDEGLGRLNSIIDTLQLAEKVDLDTLEYLPVPSSLRALIDNAVNEWHSSLNSHHLNMDIHMKEDIHLPIDKTLLLLVFRQILVNAIEYSEEGATITIGAVQGHSSVEITVRDTGCGIPAKDMEHMFEKYRRASNAPKKKPDGNGLGLYIAKGIIEKAGGHIWIESWLGKGTVVHFTLPLHHD